MNKALTALTLCTLTLTSLMSVTGNPRKNSPRKRERPPVEQQRDQAWQNVVLNRQIMQEQLAMLQQWQQTLPQRN